MFLERLLDVRSPLLVLFGVGTIFIVLMRTVVSGLFGAFLAAAVAVVAIAVLALHYKRRERADLWLGGDEAYYLGFLFTLVSLIVAVLQLFVLHSADDPQQLRNQELIGNFGVALVSTVAGILARVLLQSEAESIDGGERGELEIADISQDVLALRREIRDATDALAHFRRMAVRSAEEAKTHTETLARTFNEDMIRTMRGELRKGSAAWRDLGHQVALHQSQLAQRSEELLARFDDTVGAKIDEIAEAWQTVGSALAGQGDALSSRLEESASVAADRVAASWGALVESLRALPDRARADMADISATLSSLQSLQEGLDAVAHAIGHAAQRLEALSRHVDAATTGLDTRASEVVAAQEAFGREMAAIKESALKDLRDSAEADRRQVEDHAERWQQAVRKLADNGEAQLAAASANLDAARRLNEELGAHASRWSAAADETNKTLTSVVGELTDIVRKS